MIRLTTPPPFTIHRESPVSPPFFLVDEQGEYSYWSSAAGKHDVFTEQFVCKIMMCSLNSLFVK